MIEPSLEKLLRVIVGLKLSEKAPAVDFDAEAIASMHIEAVHDPEKPLGMEFHRVEVKLERNKPRAVKWMPESHAVNE